MDLYRFKNGGDEDIFIPNLLTMEEIYFNIIWFQNTVSFLILFPLRTLANILKCSMEQTELSSELRFLLALKAVKSLRGMLLTV